MRCFLCFQGYHECEQNTSKVSSLPSPLPQGLVWLCTNCTQTNNPIPAKPSKSRGASKPASKPTSIPPSSCPSPAAVATSVLSTEELTLRLETVQRQQQQTVMAEADLEVCEALKVGKCPHGISGRTLVNGVSCSKAHPKRCQKFTRFGTNAKKGCTLGSNCEHYHTQHCKSSQKNRQCFNEKCTFVHLAGTKRSKLPANPKSDSNNTNLTEQKKPGRNRLKSGSEMAKTSSDHFLEMKTLLESMQEKFQKELKSLQEQVTYQASKISSLVPPMAHQGLCQMIPNPTINHIMPSPLNPARTVPWGYTPQSFH